MSKILDIHNLTVRNKNTDELLIKGIDIDLNKGEILGLVGESGSGKSLTVKSLMNILDSNLESSWDDKDNNKLLDIRMAMIFQDPMTALNPLRTVEFHLLEVINRYLKLSKEKAIKLALEELEKVGIDNPKKRLKQYPFELSGGLRQRVMIAMALLIKPKVLIADEPTTALDVTIQTQILYTIKKLAKEENLSVILVTHDFGVVAGMCDRVNVMNSGVILEKGETDDIFYNPQNKYTIQLLDAAKLENGSEENNEIPKYTFNSKNLVEKKITDTHSVFEEI